MTNHWNDIKNSDVIMIIGSNAAENHPVAFRWVTEAMKNGAKLISVDPRFTRSSSKASIVDGIQLYSQMRSGTDIAFMMGMMKYAVDNGRVNMEYVKSCTNASFLIDPNFETCRDNSIIPDGTGTGTFSGLVPSGAAHKRYAYDNTTWAYQYDAPNDLKVDPNLGANTVWEAFVEQISAYDIATVCSITGANPTTLAKIYDVYTSTYLDHKSACIMYAMGSTQHTYGTQNVRSYAMMQLLLGNVGVAGGGINALRGESNVQGSTDMCLLWHILPGYLAATTTAHTDRATYKATYSEGKAPQDPDPTTDPVSLSWWRFGGKYIDSLLQAWWPLEHTGDADLDTAYTYLPKAVAGTAYSHIDIFEAMDAGTIKGLMCWGQNPAVGGPSLGFERKALENLDWLVCVDLWETETAAFWKGPGVTPGDVETVVYLLPAAASYEKEGSVTNSGRWSQWRYKAAEPPGAALDDLQIINLLAKKLISLYSPGGTALANPVAKLHWGFYPGTDAHGEIGSSPNGYETAGHADPHKVAWEINGYWCPSSGDKAGHRVDGFWGTGTYSTLQENGLTSSGNWLYCSHYPDDENRQERMDNVDTSACGIGLYGNWSYAWPLNRRIIYNGASVYQTGHPNVGEPLAPHKFVLKYTDGGTVLVSGCDVPDGYKPPGGAGARYPFIMQREGHAHLYGPGRADGPFPEHYEPWETPLTSNPLGTDVLVSPTLHAHERAWDDERAAPGEFPIVATTYRLTEHWQAGQMTRNNPWLCELMPDAFVELSQELADVKGIVNGDMVKITTKRTAAYGSFMRAVACVTKRFKPYNVAGGTLHHIGVIWHFGYTGCCTGDSGNLLTAHVGDANTGIPESKAFTCDIERL